MNPLLPFVLIPVLAIGAGIALVVMAVARVGPHDSFLAIGTVLIATGILLPFLFRLITRPRK